MTRKPFILRSHLYPRVFSEQWKTTGVVSSAYDSPREEGRSSRTLMTRIIAKTSARLPRFLLERSCWYFAIPRWWSNLPAGKRQVGPAVKLGGKQCRKPFPRVKKVRVSSAGTRSRESHVSAHTANAHGRRKKLVIAPLVVTASEPFWRLHYNEKFISWSLLRLLLLRSWETTKNIIVGRSALSFVLAGGRPIASLSGIHLPRPGLGQTAFTYCATEISSTEHCKHRRVNRT